MLLLGLKHREHDGYSMDLDIRNCCFYEPNDCVIVTSLQHTNFNVILNNGPQRDLQID